jgi:DNA-binding LacI/PurR family transcriptional regulator
MKKKPMSEKRVTIKDVALKAGVSIGAVSRVLHGRASTIRVSEATSEVIRKAAKDLNYKPNRSAQSLRSGRTRTITIAAPFEISFASNPYYASILDSILVHAAAKGYTVCLSKASVGGTVSFEDSKGKFDGIIWLGTPTPFSESDSKLEELPQVGIHLEDAGLPEKLINVKADEVQAIINYVGHLRVNDVSKIGLFARSGDSAGLLSDKQLKDLCKRIAIDYIPYKSVDEVPALAQKAGIAAGLVWHLEDAVDLGEILGSKKPALAPIITDANAAKGNAFVFPIHEMVRTAIEIITSKIENPQAAVASVALAIPAPA